MSNMSKMIQASTLNALMLGNFDRTISVKEFLRGAMSGLVPIPVWTARPSLKTALPTVPRQREKLP